MGSISKLQNGPGGKKSAAKAGARPGERRSSGAKPSGTNLDRGGGSAAKSARTSGSAARGRGARAT
jgi:hypothetical protein